MYGTPFSFGILWNILIWTLLRTAKRNYIEGLFHMKH